MGQQYYTSNTEWQEFIKDALSDYHIYAPMRNNDNLAYQKVSEYNVASIELNTYRPIQPIKSFLFFFYEQITNVAKFPNLRGFVVMGVKACDLNSLQLYDKMFLEGEFAEPFYKRRRQDLLLIGSDCQEPIDTCFCTVLNNAPYPEENYDINVSSTGMGLIIDVNSAKGEDFIKIKKDIFQKVVDRSILMKREAKRRAAIEKVEQINRQFDIKAPFLELLRNKLYSEVWKTDSQTCVTCGACTQICPTCYCFLIEEAKSKREKEPIQSKFRYWDSCQYTGFVRVAGGANPRKKKHERLRHRYLHKFDYIRENFGFDGCTGCGRCIAACQGKIDMRKVFDDLKKAENNA